MINILIILCMALIFCCRAYSESKIYNLIKRFPSSKIDQAAILDLRNRDASEEKRMIDGGNAPFKWVTNHEVMHQFFTPVPGENTVYVLSAVELWKNNEPPFLGNLLHVTICVEVDSRNNVILGFSYPLEYAQHFLTSELREIRSKSGKFEHLATIEFKDGVTGGGNVYSAEGILDLTWLKVMK